MKIANRVKTVWQSTRNGKQDKHRDKVMKKNDTIEFTQAIVRNIQVASAIGYAILSFSANAADWPMFRGPHANGSAPAMPTEWRKPVKCWQAPMAGKSYGGIALVKDKLVTTDHNEATDFLRCHDTETGKELWVFQRANGKNMDYGASPRSHPSILNERAYFMTAWGDVFCLSMADGSIVWQMDLVKDHGGKTPEWGFCGAMVFDGSSLFLQPGEKSGLMAVDAATGNVLWKSPASVTNYASLTIGAFGGRRQIIGYDDQTVRGWDLANGREIWQLPVRSPNKYIVPTPVEIDGKLYLTDDANGARLYGFDQEGKALPQPLAENKLLGSELATPVMAGDILLASSWGLFVVDPDNLKILWPPTENDKETKVEVGSPKTKPKPEDEALAAEMLSFATNGGQVWIFSQTGDLLLGRVSKHKYDIIGYAKLCGETQVLPAFAGNKIVVRDESTLYCFKLGD
jgi:outer membrane protein assembly factor BamB